MTRDIAVDEAAEIFNFVRDDQSGLTIECFWTFLNYINTEGTEKHTVTQLLEMAKSDWDL